MAEKNKKNPGKYSLREQQDRLLRPRSNICTNQDEVLLSLEMPGVEKQDLELHIENNELSIIGRRKQQEAGRYLIRERVQGDFRAVYTLDETIDQEKVDAVLENGVLTVTLHIKESVKPRKIQIKGN
jgi:HSP20 family protein